MAVTRHDFEPVWDANSKILILGSFPSVKSREVGFYYGNPRNRFYSVLSALLGVSLPVTTEQKKQMLLTHSIALSDVLRGCTIHASSDTSIKDPIPDDLLPVLRGAQIKMLFTNGKKADALYKKYLMPKIGRDCVCLPSTSPANAQYSLSRLIDCWSIILDYL